MPADQTVPEVNPVPVKPDASGASLEGLESYIRKEYDRRMEERRQFESQWQLNMAHLEGNQYAEVHPVTGEIHVPERHFDWELRDSFNHLAPIYETRLAKLGRNRTVLMAVPGSPEDEDVSSAKVATKLLAYNQDEQHMDELLADATNWSEATGTVLLKSIWNPAKGKALTDPLGNSFAIGDIETIVCSPFEILPHDSLKSRLEDQFSLMHVKAYPLDSDHVQTLKELGAKMRGEEMQIHAEDVQAVTVGRGWSVVSGASIPKFSVRRLKEHVTVAEYYERPTRKHPTGRCIIALNWQIVHVGALPYQNDDEPPDFPFVKVDCIRRTNCFWSKAVLERLIPVQRRYNVLRNRVAEYLNRVGIGQWTAQEGTTDIDMITNAPGLVIEYARGAEAPRPVVFASLPSTFRDELADLKREFEDISGIHEVSQGRVPSGSNSPSGIMVAQLQEADDTRLSTTQHYRDTATAKMGRQWLQRYRQFAMENRTVPIVGRNNIVHVYHFDRSTLRAHNVKVQNSSALAMSPGSRRDMVIQLLDKGMFNDPASGKLSPEGKQKVWQLLEFGNWEDFDEDAAVPESRAMWENVLLSAGQAVPVYPWENHLIHMAAIQRYRQTDEFYDLLESPNGQQVAMLFEQHYQAHMAYMAPPVASPGVPGAAQTPETLDLAALAQQASQIQAQNGPGAADQFLRQQSGAA